jgi:hypothetical protein
MMVYPTEEPIIFKVSHMDHTTVQIIILLVIVTDLFINIYNLITSKKIEMDLENLKTEVAENKDVVASAVTLLRGLKQRLDDAGTDEVKLKELSDSLSETTDGLAAAVAENTPAASTPE